MNTFSARQRPTTQQLVAWLLAAALLLAHSVGALHRTQHGLHSHEFQHQNQYEHEHEHQHAQGIQTSNASVLFSHEQGRDCLLFDALAGGDLLSFTVPNTGLPACAAHHLSSRYASVSAQRLAGAKAARGPPLLLLL